MKKEDLAVGDLVAFQIGEADGGFSSPNKEKWGVFTVLDLGDPKDKSFSLSVKSGLWDAKPNWWQAVCCPLLVETRFEKLGNKSRNKPEIFTTPLDCVIDLVSVQIIGRVYWFSAIEKAARKKILQDGYYTTLANIDGAPRSIDHEDRAENDTAAWKAEIEAYQANWMKQHQEKELREKEKLRNITLTDLHDEVIFADWDERTQIVPAEFTNEVRKKGKALISRLQRLPNKPKRKDVRDALKDFVEWLNKFDGSHGYAIETEEREDLMEFIEEVCWAAKQKVLIEEADSWRDW